MTYLNNLFNLKNKIAILTGGGGILAGEMALGLLNAGAIVILMDINEKNLSKRQEILRKRGLQVHCFRCDVTDENNLKDLYQSLLADFKRIDILINAAGGNIHGATIGIDQNIFDLDINQYKKVTDLNLLGTVLPTLIFSRAMAEQKSGSVINISSMATQRAITRVMGYSVAKSGVENFTRWMAVELALKFGSGIRVNAIAPGFLLTEQNRKLLTQQDGSLTDRGKTIIGLTPFKRFGDPTELVGTTLWLASDASKFVTGTVIPVDGGFSVFSGV